MVHCRELTASLTFVNALAHVLNKNIQFQEIISEKNEFKKKVNYLYLI
jgi:hypothetical protein